MKVKTKICSNCGHKQRADIVTCRFCHGLPLPIKYIKGQCPLCGNTGQTREGYCSYCSWKGTTGPGAELKELIKELIKEPKND